MGAVHERVPRVMVHALGCGDHDPDAVVACDGREPPAAAAGLDPAELGLGQRGRDHLDEHLAVAEHTPERPLRLGSAHLGLYLERAVCFMCSIRGQVCCAGSHGTNKAHFEMFGRVRMRMQVRM